MLTVDGFNTCDENVHVSCRRESGLTVNKRGEVKVW